MHCYKPGPARQETSFLQRASKVSYILGYDGKNVRLKVSYKWFLKRGALLYFVVVPPHFWLSSRNFFRRVGGGGGLCYVNFSIVFGQNLFRGRQNCLRGQTASAGVPCPLWMKARLSVLTTGGTLINKLHFWICQEH